MIWQIVLGGKNFCSARVPGFQPKDCKRGGFGNPSERPREAGKAMELEVLVNLVLID
jgi:hypothetical protein